VFRNFLKKIRRRQLFGGHNTEIDPDVIFMDSTNLPEFDTDQFEGRIVHPIDHRSVLGLGVFFALLVIIFVGKLWYIEIYNGSVYAETSENNREKRVTIFADRGIVYDRKHVPLVWNDIVPNAEYSIRTYASTTGLSLLLGYLDYPKKDKYGYYYKKTFDGKSGIEESFNDLLSGTNGEDITEIDALGNVVSKSVVDEPVHGQNITLSIDSKLQHRMFEVIEKSAYEYGFQSGAGILMDVESGEIITMASYPEYSSTVMTNGTSEGKSYELNRRDNPFLNRVISGLYTPGSIVKPFIAIAALTEDIIAPEKQILSTGALKIPNPYFPGQFSVFGDWKAHGWVDMRHALAVSSDVYFYEIGGGFEDQPGLGIVRIDKYMKLFGFGGLTGIGLSSEKEGTIPTPEWKKKMFNGEEWRIGNTYHTAIGQYGFQVTPLQAVRAAAALANGGKLVTPHLMLNDKTAATQNIPLSLDARDFQIVREGMRLSVTEGIAQNENVPYVKVAAKTGTAEVGISKSLVNSWVIGFFPYDHPRYAFAVVMERGPRANLVGSPYVFRQVLDWKSINTPEYFR